MAKKSSRGPTDGKGAGKPQTGDYREELKRRLSELKQAETAAKAHRRAPPPPQGRSVPQVAPERAKTDDELFLQAVKGVDQDAVLKKYDETPLPAPPSKPREAVVREEQALFTAFVGPVDKKI